MGKDILRPIIHCACIHKAHFSYQSIWNSTGDYMEPMAIPFAFLWHIISDSLECQCYQREYTIGCIK